MRYIVVYTILILGAGSLKTAAQKPTIDLLPSAHENIHTQAMVDTCVTPDSLLLFDSIAPLPEADKKVISESLYKEGYSPALRRRSLKTFKMLKPGLLPLFIKSSNPIHFIIHFTALKF